MSYHFKIPNGLIKILFLADTHLGFDFPFRPRIQRRRRGPDFFRNFELALAPALKGKVDLVVHGGDILYRYKVPSALVDMAFMPLRKVADQGVPVYIVPGNHERSSIPFRILAEHPNIFIFDKPKYYAPTIRGFKLSLVGFPFVRHDIRKKFHNVLKRTRWKETEADASLLCIHQSIDGATFGVHDFTFKYGSDVININEIPQKFAAVLTGHIHRFQVLNQNLHGQNIVTPVFYSGSIERTSFAEREEPKGYITLSLTAVGAQKGKVNEWKFHKLPTRPMKLFEYDNTKNISFESWLQQKLSKIPQDSIVKIKISGTIDPILSSKLSASNLRLLVPDTMNVTILRDMYRKNPS